MTDNVIRLNGVATPRLDEYFGLWAYEASRFLGAFERVSRMDIRAHVAETPKPKLESAPVIVAQNEVPLGSVPNADRKVGVISLAGPLMKQVGSMEEGTSTVALRLAIRQAVAREDIGAIMFVVDSPGGTVAGTADLAAEIEAACEAKPCAVLIEDLCASAAYWVASACPKVYANTETALVGSIGTYLGLYDLSGWATKEGIKAKVYATGAHKGAGFPGSEITPEQDQKFQAMVDETQSHFAAAVGRYRNLSDEQVSSVATGECFLAAKAQAAGLIDGIKTFDQVLEELTVAMRTPGNSSGRQAKDLIKIEDDPKDTEKKKDPNDSTVAGRVEDPEKKPDSEDPEKKPDAEDEKKKEPGAKAATLQELKSALPKSTADFREKCLEDGLTLSAAKDRYISDQDAALDDARAKSKQVGVAPVRSSGKPVSASENPKAQLIAIASSYQANGMKRHEAFARACRENPELRTAMNVEHNEQFGRSKAAKALASQ